MYGNALGRFITPDPLLNSGRPWNPQTWNRYTYALNNPLRIIDPTGLYNLENTCGASDSKCNKQFQQHAKDLKQGRENLQNKVNKMKTVSRSSDFKPRWTNLELKMTATMWA